MIKNSRRQAIIDIINTFNISTQEELTAKLVEKGFNVSQATISRDIKELNLIKVEQKYAVIEDFSQKLSSKLVNLFKQITISIEVQII